MSVFARNDSTEVSKRVKQLAAEGCRCPGVFSAAAFTPRVESAVGNFTKPCLPAKTVESLRQVVGNLSQNPWESKINGLRQLQHMIKSAIADKSGKHPENCELGLSGDSSKMELRLKFGSGLSAGVIADSSEVMILAIGQKAWERFGYADKEGIELALTGFMLAIENGKKANWASAQP